MKTRPGIDITLVLRLFFRNLHRGDNDKPNLQAEAAVKPESGASPEAVGDVRTSWGVLKLSYLGR